MWLLTKIATKVNVGPIGGGHHKYHNCGKGFGSAHELHSHKIMSHI